MLFIAVVVVAAAAIFLWGIFQGMKWMFAGKDTDVERYTQNNYLLLLLYVFVVKCVVYNFVYI